MARSIYLLVVLVAVTLADPDQGTSERPEPEDKMCETPSEAVSFVCNALCGAGRFTFVH